jgi:hypothetical protein
MTNFWYIFSVIVFIAGLLDALKYSFLTAKIKRLGSSKGISRQFNNVAVFHKVILSIWATFYLHEWAVALASIIALFNSIELWIVTYKYYPFKNRGRFGWKKPFFWKYLINSLTPNTKAERL